MYTNPSNIASFLGATLTASQQTQAGIVAQAISDWIDHEMGRSWQQVSPVADELHTMTGDRVYLNNRPVVEVTSVKTRTYYPDLGTATLDVSQYELLDAANGLLVILGWSAKDLLALVSYTHTATQPPSDVALAATILAADLLTTTLHPESAGIDSIAVGQNDLSVKFSSAANVSPAVSRALDMIRGRRTIVIA